MVSTAEFIWTDEVDPRTSQRSVLLIIYNSLRQTVRVQLRHVEKGVIHAINLEP